MTGIYYTLASLKETKICYPSEEELSKQGFHIYGLWEAIKTLEKGLNETKRAINLLHNLNNDIPKDKPCLKE